MVKLIQSVLVALLAVAVLGACSSVKESIHKATAPTTPQQASPAQSVVTPTVPAYAPQAIASVTRKELGQFPSSSAKPVGKPWQKMHVQGFTGNYKEACILLGLTSAECKKYEASHSAGTCTVMEVPNGVVLDRLTFTRDGKHQVQGSVKVDLKNPPSRKAEVCDLGGGVIAIRFWGCNNHALVRGWTQPQQRLVTVATPVATAAGTACTKPTYWRVRVWEGKATEVSGVPALLKVKSPSATDTSYYDSDDLSRMFGDTFIGLEKQGHLKLDGGSHAVIVNHLKLNGTSVMMYDGVVKGMLTGNLPEDFRTGESIQVEFNDLRMFVSPRSDIRARHSEFVKCTTAIHAIVK